MTPEGYAGGLRAANKERTRAALVDAALRQFAARGFGPVTVEEICAEAGVSPRTFFRYFATKDHVLAAPVVMMVGRLSDALARQPDTVPAWAALRAALHGAADCVDENAELFRAAGQVIRANPGALSTSAEALMSWEQSTRSEVQRRLRVGDDSLAPGLLLGTGMVALRLAVDRWTESPDAGSVRAILDTALDAVTPGADALSTPVVV